jgi:hypothetical protein
MPALTQGSGSQNSFPVGSLVELGPSYHLMYLVAAYAIRELPMDELIELLEKRGACDPSLDWLRSLPLGTTLREAWERCENGSWLLWLLVRVYPKSAAYHQFILRVANRAIEVAGEGADPALVQLVRDREAWCQGATLSELESSITWSKDAAWQAGFSLVGPEWRMELRMRADDLRSLFSRPDLSLLARKTKGQSYQSPQR